MASSSFQTAGARVSPKYVDGWVIMDIHTVLFVLYISVVLI